MKQRSRDPALLDLLVLKLLPERRRYRNAGTPFK